MSGPRAPLTVDFFADLTCPWCYIGWAGLKQAALQRPDVALSVAWRTFLLNPDTPAEGYDRRAYLAQRFAGHEDKLNAAHQTLERMAGEANAPLNIMAARRIPNTIDAHRIVHWASSQGVGEALIDALFAAYFVEGQDLGAADVLLAAAEQCGLDPQEIAGLLASDADRHLMLEFHAAAARLGLSGVPVAVFNRKVPVMGAETPANYARAIDTALA